MKLIRVTCKDETNANSINKIGNDIKKDVIEIDKLLQASDKLLDEISNDSEALAELKKIRGLKSHIGDIAFDLDLHVQTPVYDAGA